MEHLPHIDEVVHEYFESPALDSLLVQTVQTTFPSQEHSHFVPHYRGLLEGCARDQRYRPAGWDTPPQTPRPRRLVVRR